jgi:hypothetical protein
MEHKKIKRWQKYAILFAFSTLSSWASACPPALASGTYFLGLGILRAIGQAQAAGCAGPYWGPMNHESPERHTGGRLDLPAEILKRNRQKGGGK